MARRRNAGEGTIFRRADGRWSAVLNLGWEAGRRRRKYFYGATAASVQDKITKAKNDLRVGLPVKSDRQSLGDFMARWLEESARPRIKVRSYERFAELIRLHIKPALGAIRLEKLTPADVQRLLNAKHRDGLSAQTVTHIRNVLRNALNQALRWGLVTRNVATLVDAPRIQGRAVRVLSPDEARGFLQAVNGERYEATYTVGLALGLRRGELLGLRWPDVDLDGARLGIVASLQRVAGKLELTETKTLKSRRTIPLPQYAVKALRAQRARQAEERLAAGSRWIDNGLVFTNHLGCPVEPVSLRRDFRRLLKKAGLPMIRLHDLRHSAASLMLAQGVPLKTIQEILGHSSISVTANLYAHLGEQLKREAADAMDRVFSR